LVLGPGTGLRRVSLRQVPASVELRSFSFGRGADAECDEADADRLDIGPRGGVIPIDVSGGDLFTESA